MNKLFESCIFFKKQFFQTQQGVEEENMFIMKNLSPTESGTKKVFRQIFSLEDNYVLDILQSDEFKAFLINDATTTQGRNAIAKHFGVDEEWENVKSKATLVEQYYQLLYLVKTKSTKDTLWISFIEGLYQHAAMVMSLLCSIFDLENNCWASVRLRSHIELRCD